jgi:hypothetical protein
MPYMTRKEFIRIEKYFDSKEVNGMAKVLSEYLQTNFVMENGDEVKPNVRRYYDANELPQYELRLDDNSILGLVYLDKVVEIAASVIDLEHLLAYINKRYRSGKINHILN